MDATLAPADVRLTYEAQLARIADAEARGDDVWELACTAGAEAADDADRGKYMIGELAARVQKKYGENRIGEFAKQVKRSQRQAEEYRAVVTYWGGMSACADFHAAMPNLSYSHLRLGMRFKADRDAARGWLEECADNDWTVEQASVVLTERLKDGGGTGPRKLLDVVASVVSVQVPMTGPARVCIEVGDGADPDALRKLAGQRVRVKVYAAGEVS